MAKDKKQKKKDCNKVSTFWDSNARIKCMRKQGLLGSTDEPKPEEKEEYSDEQYKETAKTPDNVKSTDADKKKSAEAVAKRRAEISERVAKEKAKKKKKMKKASHSTSRM